MKLKFPANKKGTTVGGMRREKKNGEERRKRYNKNLLKVLAGFMIGPEGCERLGSGIISGRRRRRRRRRRRWWRR